MHVQIVRALRIVLASTGGFTRSHRVMVGPMLRARAWPTIVGINGVAVVVGAAVARPRRRPP